MLAKYLALLVSTAKALPTPPVLGTVLAHVKLPLYAAAALGFDRLRAVDEVDLTMPDAESDTCLLYTSPSPRDS